MKAAFYALATLAALTLAAPLEAAPQQNKKAAQKVSKKAAKKPAKKAAAKKAAPAKSAKKILLPSRRPMLAAPQPEIKSPDSLEGEKFTGIGSSARLNSADAGRYANIFSLQDVGNFAKANKIIHRLDDHRLMGHVLFQRYLHPGYKATSRELADWLRAYADHPGAQKVYDLARKRGAAADLPLPVPGRGLVDYHDYDTGQLAQPEGKGGSDDPAAAWNAGLAAWRKKDYAAAAPYFEKAAGSPRASAWTQSAGAFWAARCHLRGHHPELVGAWLQKAAEHPRSFYGIIAVKALGLEQTRFNWELPALNDTLVDALAKVPAGKRALALLDAGQSARAEQEMRQINPADDLTLQRAMMAFAHEAGEPAFEMRLGSGLQDEGGRLYDAALYPDAPWRPEGGYKVDKALVHAFIRQESRFETDAHNKSSGATGLMQLMPATARALGGSDAVDQLQRPALNIALGQKYLDKLLKDDAVKNNLFRLAVAYNAGPGNLAKWEKALDYENDPLLFIETLPAAETRLFIEKVMTNYWIYRLKYKQTTHSLEMVASGEWPLYAAQDSFHDILINMR